MGFGRLLKNALTTQVKLNRSGVTGLLLAAAFIGMALTVPEAVAAVVIISLVTISATIIYQLLTEQ